MRRKKTRAFPPLSAATRAPARLPDGPFRAGPIEHDRCFSPHAIGQACLGPAGQGRLDKDDDDGWCGHWGHERTHARTPATAQSVREMVDWRGVCALGWCVLCCGAWGACPGGPVRDEETRL